MATYDWTNLTNGQVLRFDPSEDRLAFNNFYGNQIAIAGLSTTSTRFTAGGKSVTLDGLGIDQIVSRDYYYSNSDFYNVWAGDGARIMVGDNSTDHGDDGANALNPTFRALGQTIAEIESADFSEVRFIRVRTSTIHRTGLCRL